MQGTCGFFHSVLGSLDFSEWMFAGNLWFSYFYLFFHNPSSHWLVLKGDGYPGW